MSDSYASTLARDPDSMIVISPSVIVSAVQTRESVLLSCAVVAPRHSCAVKRSTNPGGKTRSKKYIIQSRRLWLMRPFVDRSRPFHVLWNDSTAPVVSMLYSTLDLNCLAHFLNCVDATGYRNTWRMPPTILRRVYRRLTQDHAEIHQTAF